MLSPGPVHNYQTPGLRGSTRTGLGTCQNACSLMTGRALFLVFCFNFISGSFWGIDARNVTQLFPGFIHSSSSPGKRRPASLSQRSQRTQSFHIFPVLVSISIYATSEKHSFHSIVLEISSTMMAY